MTRVTLRDVAVRDFRALDAEIQRRARKQFEKLERHPELGDDLGHKMGINLTGYRALHFGRNRYRIIYRWLPDENEVEVWGIGKREAGAIYRMTAPARLGSTSCRNPSFGRRRHWVWVLANCELRTTN